MTTRSDRPGARRARRTGPQTAAFADDGLENLIGGDGVTETVLYLLSAGHPVRTAVPGDRRFVPPAPLGEVRLT